MKRFFLLSLLTLLAYTFAHSQESSWTGPSVNLSHGRLKVSDNKRFLTFEDGTPFFYLGDTGWELFHRLNKEETERYLENRRAKGFTVIQAVVLAELDGLNTPNAEGNKHLFDNDPLKPNEAYFAHVDWVIKKAAEKGIFIGMLPTWGDKWNRKWGAGPQIFTPENARAYGRFLGKRYRNDPNIIWILGGDRPIEKELHLQIIEAMAEGLREGDGGAHLISFHPTGGEGSSQNLHNEKWLDFNMRQNGHSPSFTERYFQTYEDYLLKPVKPVIDAEPIYEDHPINFNPDANGHSVASDVRRPLYWDLFSGACGHTYGHHSVWQMFAPGRSPVNRPLMPWFDALDQQGAAQMIFGRRLMESRPYFTRIPDNSIIVQDNVVSSVPGAGSYMFVATRDSEGSYAMIYVPVGRKFTVRMDFIKGKEITAWWFNPRNGKATATGKFPNTGTRTFLSPDPGESLDWILVLDDSEKKFPAPGSSVWGIHAFNSFSSKQVLLADTVILYEKDGYAGDFPVIQKFSNWQNPDNFQDGVLHIRIEVRDKPNNTTTTGILCRMLSGTHKDRSQNLRFGIGKVVFKSIGTYHYEVPVSEAEPLTTPGNFRFDKAISGIQIVATDVKGQMISAWEHDLGTFDGKIQDYFPLKIRYSAWLTVKGKDFDKPKAW